MYRSLGVVQLGCIFLPPLDNGVLNARGEGVLALIECVSFRVHVFADAFKALLHLFVALALDLVKLGVLSVDDPVQTFNDVLGLLFVCLSISRERDVFGEVL